MYMHCYGLQHYRTKKEVTQLLKVQLDKQLMNRKLLSTYLISSPKSKANTFCYSRVGGSVEPFYDVTNRTVQEKRVVGVKNN